MIKFRWKKLRYYRRVASTITLQQFGFSSLTAQAQPVPQKFDSHAYARMLQHCIKNIEPINGKPLHGRILKTGNCPDLFVSNILINFYLTNELLPDGVKVFDEMPHRNTVTFVTMIRGYTQCEMYDRALELFFRLHKEGHELNAFVFSTVLKLIVRMEWAELAWCIHACIHKLGHGSNAVVGTALIDAYSLIGFVDVAKGVFNEIIEPDMVSWTGMVCCLADNDKFTDSLKLYNNMRMEGLVPNNFTFASVIKACLGLEAFEVGRSVHACILKTCHEMDHYVGVSLLDLYTRSGGIDDALLVFEDIPKADVVPWSFMIARYSQSYRCEEALSLFLKMRKALVSPNQFTLASVLQACATTGSLDFGRQTHSLLLKFGLDLNLFVSNALMDVYAKCGEMDASMNLFVELSNKSEVSWNTMIVGFVQLGEGEKAFQLFLNMLEEQVHATEVTYSSLLRASASLAALEPGIQIHAMSIKTMHAGADSVTNALIDMYAKCGRIQDARMSFDCASKQDVISWNTIISAYSMHGLGAEALIMFENMINANMMPNVLTFIGVLSACSNTGSLDRGRFYFNSMEKDYGVTPSVEHYTCMVSLMGRLGHLDEAVKLIKEMPYQPSVMIWRALLGACATQNNAELAQFAASHLIEMEPQDESTYVLLSNIYATEKRWDNVAFVRDSMRKRRVKKDPGLSWVEYKGIVHYFSVGDDSHPDIKLIRGILEWLNARCRKVGYSPNLAASLLDVEEDEKARHLWLHSERIALAFSLVRLPPGSPIRIIKNLRICTDCHAAMKFISKIVQREIVIRDINRFHHFEDGSCSCNDYW